LKLRIGISPCPNDTFIFDAIYSKKIDTSPFEFEFIFEDVETLNNLGLHSSLDIIKLSYANYFNVTDNYIMLRSGGALGKGVGPLLIAKKKMELSALENLQIAIPGIHTTASFLLSYAFPQLKNKKVYLFSEIEKAVLDEAVDAGVIIHENRFTYQEKGLVKLMDLGEYWETQTHLPIPLGGIAIRRELNLTIQKEINDLIRKSIEYNQSKYPSLSPFITSHAQEMSEEVMRQHIELYVNNFSLDVGDEGIKAVEKMAAILGKSSPQKLFI